MKYFFTNNINDILKKQSRICKNTLDPKLNSIKQPYIDGDKLKEKDSKVPAIFDCFELQEML